MSKIYQKTFSSSPFEGWIEINSQSLEDVYYTLCKPCLGRKSLCPLNWINLQTWDRGYMAVQHNWHSSGRLYDGYIREMLKYIYKKNWPSCNGDGSGDCPRANSLQWSPLHIFRTLLLAPAVNNVIVIVIVIVLVCQSFLLLTVIVSSDRSSYSGIC